MQSAKHIQKLKHIKKVRSAIRYHERLRRERAPLIKERIQRVQSIREQHRFQAEQIRGTAKTALKNAREDWKLGSLRPNRAVGAGAEKYGAITGDQLRRPLIPWHLQEQRNLARVKQGRDIEYPIVFKEEKYFPIAEGDRVVVMRGREKGKIAVVEEIQDQTHEVHVKDVNTHYLDSDVAGAAQRANFGPKHARELPLPLSDVRLVVRYKMTSTVDGRPRTVEQDVIVDRVEMERHTTGIDPFTGIDYGSEQIPEEHQQDPETGNPIFNRFIAGTDHRIEWPWEKSAAEEDKDKPAAAINEEKNSWQDAGRSWASKAASSLNPRTYLPGKRAAPADEAKEDANDKKAPEDPEPEDEVPRLPRGKPVRVWADFDDDTLRNKIEGTENFVPRLVEPPHPAGLVAELEAYSAEESVKEASVKEPRAVRPEQQPLLVDEQPRTAPRDPMMTPLQLRWELERAQKIVQGPEKGALSKQALMAALGQHMQASRLRKKEDNRRREVEVDLLRKAERETAEVD
ncbi:hypothetical protein BDV95DRAFT_491297 [Massariosphaeria phaeospora]|uniref:KOW domain-containing protein n=1 Tax=Massariosphaeria phaeospora TaxID=100035 RepID=A0A7C8IGX3_9PLEO|nr:hypothetical protein BDV95DRAFT_491297 [Massariosphaeria phaeospora]